MTIWQCNDAGLQNITHVRYFDNGEIVMKKACVYVPYGGIFVGMLFLITHVSLVKPALAQDTSDVNAPTDALLALVDASQTVSISPGKCLVTVTTDKDDLIQDVDKLRSSGFLNQSYSDDYFLSNPALLVIVMAMQASSAATEGFFDANSSSKACHFKQFMSYSDNYGNEQSSLLYSYNFTRSIYSKINWSKFNDSNIPDVSQNYVSTSIMDDMEQLALQSNSQ